MIKRKFRLESKLFCISIALLFFSAFCYGQSSSDYERFVDSADVYIDISTEKAIAFLDSIPQPVNDYITEGLPNYYVIKSLIYDENNDEIKSYQSCVLALKHALEVENYKIAGEASLELFYSLYYVKKDTTAYEYLKKARTYYELSDYAYGDFEVDLTYAYAKFLDGEHKACNSLLLENLDTYKKAKDDAYFYMFATSMLASNYLTSKNLDSAYTHFDAFKALKDNPTIVSYNYASFESIIDVSFAEFYFEKKQMDSTFHYLSKSSKSRDFMTEDVEEDYLKLYADSYRFSGNIEMAKAYMDSLAIFENKMYERIMKTSFQINNDLVKTEFELKAVSDEKYFNGILVVVLLLILTVSSFIYMYIYRKQRLKTIILSDQTRNNLSYLKSNNEKLVVKVQGLEDYIYNLKKEVKKISTIGELPTQREKIKELYKALHLNSSTILDKSESHLDLVNDLNVNFFQKINKMYPQLNNSEIIICYYLHVGFKNKEIAVFLNTSVRAVESKRYRITKKIHIDKEKTTLVEHLNDTFRCSENSEEILN
ncbi:helix-turn-helix transcriptional regulator [Flavivirga spongiicola]|uniref:HTH luxR-type domain-containing protein n=1 Tax=Flavivirga spongiicola TaxID=421621 RepID=A0ABU7XNX5_9FLAO|nr:hypothetical protein [Flavivirga sp. MEBiC05379]MDO5981288.1 hypothetical protein [Flavivirga sp. MEBiC05379]